MSDFAVRLWDVNPTGSQILATARSLLPQAGVRSAQCASWRSSCALHRVVSVMNARDPRANLHFGGRPMRNSRAVVLPPRVAFTLIELMVTLVIISILGSLMLAGLAVARTSAKAAKTTSTIRKISELVLPYYERYETRRPRNSAPGSFSRLETIEFRRTALRRLMAMELPERSLDVVDVIAGGFSRYGAPVTEVSPVARRYFSMIRPVLPADFGTDPNIPDPVSSADFLHMIVMRGPVADTDVITHFRRDEIADTNGNGLPEFVDGWGQPIFFKRWPTGFNSPAQPIDGLRSSVDESLSLNGHRLVPLVFSGGPDLEPDIEAGQMARYVRCAYDPFAFFSTTDPYDNNRSGLVYSGPTPIAGSVVLYPVVVPAGEPRRAKAARWGVPAPAGTDASAWFFAIGSESDTNGNGSLESYDNIHNHDLTR